MPDLGKYEMQSILNSPEAVSIEILNVSEITWEGGGHSEEVTTSSTSGIFQERTTSDLFHRMGRKEDIDAVAYLDPSTSLHLEDEIKKADSDVSFKVDNIESRTGYKRVELSEVI